ncbi:hypothetical protein SCUP234_04965 [Seiridium cupressi]
MSESTHDTANEHQRVSTAHGHPSVRSLQDLTIVEAWDPATNTAKYTTFYYITEVEGVWFGESPKNKREISLSEYESLLQRIRDEEIYPEIPGNVQLRTISEDPPDCYIKRPGLYNYEDTRNTNFIPTEVLNEVLIMEKISQEPGPHPNIIRYLGCHVRRGRITSIVLEKHSQTLAQFAQQQNLKALDKEKFMEALTSAVAFLHEIGLAHNDINPDNIMIKTDGTPVLVDFGSCQPVGTRLQSLGTVGWCEETFYTSEKSHDEFSLKKLATWLEDPSS